jgi:hypothetical protein
MYIEAYDALRAEFIIHTGLSGFSEEELNATYFERVKPVLWQNLR